MAESTQLWMDYVSSNKIYQRLRDLKERVSHEIELRSETPDNIYRAGKTKTEIDSLRNEEEPLRTQPKAKEKVSTK